MATWSSSSVLRQPLRRVKARSLGWPSGDIKTRLEGSTVIVRIPMRFQRRGGRKRIVAADGSELVPTWNPRPNGVLACRDHCCCSSGGRICRKQASSARS